MDAHVFLKDEGLKQFIKHAKAGDFLFLQGQKAHSMLLIVEGRVRLIGEKNEEQHLVSVIESGQFLGEKALLTDTPYQRQFTALADSDLVYLEFSSQDMEKLQKTSPAIVMVLLKGILASVAARFDRSNYLIRALRSTNNMERMIHCLIYFCRSSGKRFPGGIEIIVTPASLRFYIDMEVSDIEAVIRELEYHKLLVRHGSLEKFLVPNEQALLGFLPELLRRPAA